MNKTEYRFLARYADVDFERIFAENKDDGDFIRVAWCDEKNIERSLWFATRRGKDRLDKVGLWSTTDSIKKVCIKSSGEAMINTVGNLEAYYLPPYGNSWKSAAWASEESDGSFKDLFSTLRKREERRHEIKVTAVQ